MVKVSRKKKSLRGGKLTLSSDEKKVCVPVEKETNLPEEEPLLLNPKKSGYGTLSTPQLTGSQESAPGWATDIDVDQPERSEYEDISSLDSGGGKKSRRKTKRSNKSRKVKRTRRYRKSKKSKKKKKRR